MEKNPISFLQEYMAARRKQIPNYTIIRQSTGTHINSFSMRVQCDGHIADGDGSSKKEAKTNAAINMLKLLKLYPSHRPSTSINCSTNSYISSTSEYSVPSSPSTVNTLNTVSPDNDRYTTRSNFEDSPLRSPSTLVNYVGKLQELTANKTASPIYILESITGPSHNHLFTYVCKYEEKEEKAEAKTKKEAKSLAAKKMLEKLESEILVVLPEVKCQSYLDTVASAMNTLEIYEENQMSMIASASKALEYYPKVTRTGKKVLTDDRSYDEYHTFLKDSFSNTERHEAIDQLQETIKACKNFSNESINNLHRALEILNINMREVTYLEVQGQNIYGLKLLTNPIISEIGYGINKVTAENMAVYQIAKTLSIMLL